MEGAVFYNTNKQPDLHDVQQKNKSQYNVVLAYFKERPFGKYTPFEVWQNMIQLNLIHLNTPVTSIRRAMTELSNNNRLIKTSEMKDGGYGRPAHLYKLSFETGTNLELF